MSAPRCCERCGKPLAPTKGVAGPERLACTDAACGFVRYDNPTPVVAAIVQRGDEVILVRNKGWPETWFGLVSGFLERGEEPDAAALREVREELGLSGAKAELVGVCAFPEMNQVILGYHVEVEGELSLGEELEAAKPVKVEKLRPWPFGTGHIVAAWLTRRAGPRG